MRGSTASARLVPPPASALRLADMVAMRRHLPAPAVQATHPRAMVSRRRQLRACSARRHSRCLRRCDVSMARLASSHSNICTGTSWALGSVSRVELAAALVGARHAACWRSSGERAPGCLPAARDSAALP